MFDDVFCNEYSIHLQILIENAKMGKVLNWAYDNYMYTTRRLA